MKVEFHDYAVNERPVKVFDDASALIDFLRQFKTEEFASAELRGENGYRLVIGINGEVAFAEYSSQDGEPPYLVAVSPTAVIKGTHIFLVTNEGTEIDGRHCLAFPVFAEVVRRFIETGERAEIVEWEDA